MKRIQQAGIAVLSMAMFIGLSSAPQADAASVSSLMIQGNNFASDENREYLINRGGGVTGQIDVGDSLRGIFNMNTLNSTGGNLGGLTPNNEWTGVFQVMVTNKTALGGSNFLLTFGPDPAFATSLCGGLASCTGPAAIVPGTGAMFVMFEGASHNYAADFSDSTAVGLPTSDDGTPAHTIPPSSADVGSGQYLTEEAFLTRAADGNRFWTLGFTNGVPNGPGSATPGIGEGFTGLSTGGDNILNSFSITPGSGFVLNNAGINRIQNGIAETGDALDLGVVPTPFFGGVANFAITGNTRGVGGQSAGVGLDTPFEASSNIDASFFVSVPQVPEPTSLLLFGTGFFALAGAARLRNRRS